MLFQKIYGISRNEQQAFKGLADALIFNEPLECELNTKNLPRIAQKLRNEMIDLDTRSQRKARVYSETLFAGLEFNGKKIFPEENRTVTDYELNGFLREIHGQIRSSDRTFMIGFTNSYAKRDPIYQQYMYDKWGFTPRLAELKRKDDHEFLTKVAVRKNCFGTTLGLGSYFGVRGLKFDLAITADHPYVVVYLGKETYLASLGLPIKMHNKIIECDGYKTYRPHPKDNLPHSFMVIHDFDRGILYETLENMEMLRLISKGVDVTRLPRTFEEGFEVADMHREILQRTNWKILATKLFPEITRSLLENKEDWQHELDHIIPLRKELHAQNVYFKASIEAQKSTFYKNFEFRQGQLALMKEFKMHGKEIIDFLRRDIPFIDIFISDNVRLYFKVIKEHFEKETSEIKEIYIGMLEKIFIHKNKKRTHEQIKKRLPLHNRKQRCHRRKKRENKSGRKASLSR